MTVEQAYQILYGGVLIVLILLIGAMVIRSIIGPRSTTAQHGPDRVG